MLVCGGERREPHTLGSPTGGEDIGDWDEVKEDFVCQGGVTSCVFCVASVQKRDSEEQFTVVNSSRRLTLFFLISSSATWYEDVHSSPTILNISYTIKKGPTNRKSVCFMKLNCIKEHWWTFSQNEKDRQSAPPPHVSELTDSSKGSRKER